MTSAIPRIAIAMGDPAGIGTEILASLLALPELVKDTRLLIIGDRRVLAEGERITGTRLDIKVCTTGVTPEVGHPVFFDLAHLAPDAYPRGEESAAGGRFAMLNFGKALEMAQGGELDGIVFTPFNKNGLHLGGSPYSDELAWAASVLPPKKKASNYIYTNGLWSARVTSHVPLSEVPKLITFDRVLEEVVATHEMLKRTGLKQPRIAVAALNPHASDNGLYGKEEELVLSPVIAAALSQGILAFGPIPSDTVWVRARNGEFDVVLTMYHDQGQIAMKLMGFDNGAGVLWGFPVPICTPAHGTAYDIAGTGKASNHATMEAFRVCRRLASNQVAELQDTA